MDREPDQKAPAPPANLDGGDPGLGTSVRRTSSIFERLAAAATPLDIEQRAGVEVVGTPSFARGLWRIAAADVSSGNRVALLRNGPATFSAMLELIETAETTVSLEGYIFRDDEVGRQFADALVAAAQRGVKVRLLVDWIGRLGTPYAFFQAIARGGVEVRILKFLSPAVEFQQRWVPDGLGKSGASKAFNETDLGGSTIKLKILICF